MKKRFFQQLDHPWLAKQSFKDIDPRELLNNIERGGASGGRPEAWIFDLDSTLFCVGPRIQSIFHSFLREHPGAPLHWHKALPALGADSHRYGIEESFYHIFVQHDERQAASMARELWHEFKAYWDEHFFSDRYLHHDLPYPGAREYLEAVEAKGFEIVYLTGRVRTDTRRGTVDALRAAGFPRGIHTHLFMKPDSSITDLEFKDRVSRTLAHRFDVRVSIDNEPENLLVFARHFSRAEVIFFHSVMSERIPEEDYSHALNGRQVWRMHDYSSAL